MNDNVSGNGSKPQETVGDALARRVEARRGPASRRVEVLRELGAVDRAVYEAVARIPTAALEGVVSIGVTSATVNLGMKSLHRRRRPDRLEAVLSRNRHVPMPESTSF